MRRKVSLAIRRAPAALYVALTGLLLVAGCGGSDRPDPFGGDRPEPADLVLLHGRIFTSEPDDPWAEALAVRAERFCYVGGDAGAEAYIGPDTRVLDGQGRMVTPGFFDNHSHVIYMGAMLALMGDAGEASTLEQLAAAVQAQAAAAPDLPFVMVFGWRWDYLPSPPTAALADTLLADRPLILWSSGGHNGWVNTRALQLMQERNPAALHRLTPQLDPASGDPTGLLVHFFAYNPLEFFPVEELGPDAVARMGYTVSAVLQEARAAGVTTLVDAQLQRQFIPVLQEFHAAGGLDAVRVLGLYYIDHHALEDEPALWQGLAEWRALADAPGDGHLYLGRAVKMYMDGVGGNYTAFLVDEYADKPGEHGTPLWDQEDYNRVCAEVDALGLQIGTHANGDGATRMILNGYEHALAVNGRRDSRHRIEHCELVHPDDVARLAALGVYAAMQPSHLYGDPVTERVWGYPRIHRWLPWHTLEEAGVPLSFGSDWIAAPVNPLYGLVAAGTRLNYTQQPTWGPEERIDLEQAIRYYTLGSARASFLEDDLGTIEVGKYGDFVIFSIDLHEIITPEFLAQHPFHPGNLEGFVLLTAVGGRVVHRNPAGPY